ncbi:hypothetical protein FRC03_006626 [Tulasnella sp. 419]|nr:hypothetical protein FRC03_006626 [Tulasnella sp. 419]
MNPMMFATRLPTRGRFALSGNHISKNFVRRLILDPTTKKPMRDLDIPHELVRVVDPETNKIGESPVRLESLVESVNRQKFYYQLVSEEPFPIVKLINRQEEKRVRREAKAKQKAKKVETKSIQMTWNVEIGDLKHKVAKAKQELNDGNNVELSLVKKRGSEFVPTPDRQAKVSWITEELDEIAVFTRSEPTPFITTLSFRPRAQK